MGFFLGATEMVLPVLFEGGEGRDGTLGLETPCGGWSRPESRLIAASVRVICLRGHLFFFFLILPSDDTIPIVGIQKGTRDVENPPCSQVQEKVKELACALGILHL